MKKNENNKPKNNEKIRERLGDLMGGKILQLESERLREEGQKTERVRAIQNMISLGLTKEKILTKYSEEEYEEAVKTMLVEA